MFKVTTNWLLVLGAILFANSFYFAYAYWANFGSFKLQDPNYPLAGAYASNALFVLAGLFGGRKKYSPEFRRLGRLAALSLLLVSVELVIHHYYWKLGMLLGVVNVFVSGFFVALVVDILIHKEKNHDGDVGG